MERIMEGKHTVFMIQITGKWVRHKADGMWYKTRAEEVREGASTQSEKNSIGQIQGTVSQWVALLPILKLCARDTGYEGKGCRRDAWWIQEARETHIRETLE